MTVADVDSVMHEYVKNPEHSPAHRSRVAAGNARVHTSELQRVSPLAPLDWLRRGLHDVRATYFTSLLYGVCFVLLGLGIARAQAGNPALALGLSAAFLFAGPFMALGLYELSRQKQSGERLDLLLSLFSWCRNPGAIGRFALFLSVVMVVWLSLSVTLLQAHHAGPGLTYVAALLAWVALASVVFMVSAVAIPLLLDRPVGALQAMSASVRCCVINPLALGFWAVINAVVVGISLWLHYWPLLVAGPVLGHATWHACQSCISSRLVDPGAAES